MIKVVLVIPYMEHGPVVLASAPSPGDVIDAKLNGEWCKLRVQHTEHTASDEVGDVMIMPRVHCVQIAETEPDGQ